MGEAPESKRPRVSKNYIILDVGGEPFRTSMEAMRSFPSSYFAALVSGRHRVNWEEDGSVFIDRSSKHFELILEYLRNGRQAPFNSTKVSNLAEGELDEVRLEAEYYGLTDLAQQCRRFKVLDARFVRQCLSRSGHFTTLMGMRTSAAMFDVIDPDNFEVTFAGRSEAQNSGNDFSLLHEAVNEPGVFIGIAPMDVDLSLEWEECANPLPKSNPGPFDTNNVWTCPWAREGRVFPLSVEEASPFWPGKMLLPPCLKQGLAIAISVVNFRNEKSNGQTDFVADGFLAQRIVNGDVRSERWWDRLPGSVAMRFSRSQNRCALRVSVVTKDDDESVVWTDLDLAALGMDLRLPYRPVIFFGTRTHVDVDCFCDVP